MSQVQEDTTKYDRAFFGHPKGLMPLFNAEMWERFSYYGMRAILLYFMVATIREGGLGLEEALAKSLVQIYSASVFLLAVTGGWLADRIMGVRKATLYGGFIIMAGHVFLAIPFPAAAYIGVCLVAIGTGLLKPNISTMVGKLYHDEDPRRDAGFSLFYMGINIGSFVSPFAVTAARSYFNGSYHAGFAVPAIGMAIALFVFMRGRKYLQGKVDEINNPLTEAERTKFLKIFSLSALALGLMYLGALWFAEGDYLLAVINTLTIFSIAAPISYFAMMIKSPRVNTAERHRVYAFIPIFIAAMLFWMIFEQAFSSMALFVSDNTDLNPVFFGKSIYISPEIFQSINPICIVLFAPLFTILWTKLGDRQPSTAIKMAIGLGFAAFSFLWLGGWAIVYAGTKAPVWVISLTWVYQTLGELCLSPVGLAATTYLAPRAFRSQAMALWLLSSAAGQAIAAQILKITGEGSTATMFLSIGAVTSVFALILVFLSPWISKHINTVEIAE